MIKPQAVILAAGKSTRTYPLTLTRPKPLLKVANKTILEHNLEQLQGLVSEAILVVGYKKEMIKKSIGKKFGKIKISYVEQKKQLGTGHALMTAKKKIKQRFIMMAGDDLFFKDDIKKCLKRDYCVLAQKVKDYRNFGIFVVKNNLVKKIVEKPKRKISDLANTSLYVLSKDALNYKFKLSERGEYEAVDLINYLAKTKKVYCEKTKQWLPIAYPWDLLKANEILLKKIKKSIKGRKEKHVTIKGIVVVGKGTVLKSGTYIEGPVIIGKNCTIGPNTYLRASTSIGNKCKVGNETEIKNSIIFDSSKVPHLSYIGDSVIGEHVNVGAGTITANLRHDKEVIKSKIKNELRPTGRNKLGTIIGDDAKIGIRTVIYPGRKIFPGKTTKPGQIVTEDIE